MEEYLEVGQCVSTHGVKGELKVKPLTDDITRFSKLKKIYMSIKEELIEFPIEEVRYNKNMVLLKLKGIDSMEKAEEYRGNYLKINRKDAVKLPKDSYFIIDLIGLNVYCEENDELLGKIDDIYNTGSNDIYVVKDETTGKQILLPGIKDVIRKVDIENRRIIVKILEGLLD